MHSFPYSPSRFFIKGPAGQLELLTTYPPVETQRVAIICHPHPLHEGSMHNKVVTILAKTFDALGCATLRFNFRGVGASEGQSSGKIAPETGLRNYDCQGELEDLRAVLRWLTSTWPEAQLYLAGFSFGSYVAARIAEESSVKALVSIAPPVERMPFADLIHIHCPWWVVQGEEDEVVSPEAVYEWAQHSPSPLHLIRMPEVGHFFHGKLTDLREVLLESLKQV